MPSAPETAPTIAPLPVAGETIGAMTPGAGRSWRSVVSHTLLLLVPLIVANVLLARDDPGFLAYNPSPWIALPLLLGARFGLLFGQAGAVVSAVVVLFGMRQIPDLGNAAANLSEHPWFFVSLLVAGGIGALIHALLTGPAHAAQSRIDQLAESEQTLRQEVELLRSSADDLGQRLLLHGAEFVSFQDRAREVISAPRDSIDSELLLLYQEMFGVTRAAIFQQTSTSHWQRLCALGKDHQFPEFDRFTERTNPVAAAAIQANEIASATTLWDRADTDSDLKQPSSLVAIPWASAKRGESDRRRLLLIDRIPFPRTNWETLAQIQSLFCWVSSASSMPMAKSTDGGMPTKLLDHQDFDQHLQSILDCVENFHLSYRAVLFRRTTDTETKTQNAFVRSIRSQRRRGEVVGAVALADEHPDRKGRREFGIAAIFPVNTDAAAQNRIDEILKAVPGKGRSIRHQIFSLTGDRQRFLAEWHGEVAAPTSMQTATEPSPQPAPETLHPELARTA